MALVGNGVRLTGNPMRAMACANAHSQERAAYGQPGALRNIWAGDAGISRLAGYPVGYRHPGSWSMPPAPGALSSYDEANGSATATGAIVEGRNLAGTSAGSATATGAGGLVVSASGTAAGTATVTGSVLAALNGAASASGAGSATASIGAVGHLAGSSAGFGAATALSYAIGYLAGESTTATELSPSNLAESVMDAIVESGLSVREALQVILAVNAGKVTDAESGTPKFRDVADTKDRVTAELDGQGNRTSVTLDTDG